MKNIKSFVEINIDGGIEEGGDHCLDEQSFCDGQDIFCQDGICPDCNWKEYSEWKLLHKICDKFPYECPDKEDCFYNK